MKLIDMFKEKLKEGVTSIKNLRGEISDPNWAEISVTENTGSPLTLGTPIENLKFRAQIIISGANGFTNGYYRLDNHNNKYLHQHFIESEYPVEASSLREALLMIFGSDCWKLEGK